MCLLKVILEYTSILKSGMVYWIHQAIYNRKSYENAILDLILGVICKYLQFFSRLKDSLKTSKVSLNFKK